VLKKPEKNKGQLSLNVDFPTVCRTLPMQEAVKGWNINLRLKKLMFGENSFGQAVVVRRMHNAIHP